MRAKYFPENLSLEGQRDWYKMRVEALEAEKAKAKKHDIK